MGVLGLRHFSVVSVGIEAPVSVTNSQRRKTFMGRNIKQDGFSFPRWCKLNPFFDSCSLWVWSVRVRECGSVVAAACTCGCGGRAWGSRSLGDAACRQGQTGRGLLSRASTHTPFSGTCLLHLLIHTNLSLLTAA